MERRGAIYLRPLVENFISDLPRTDSSRPLVPCCGAFTAVPYQQRRLTTLTVTVYERVVPAHRPPKRRFVGRTVLDRPAFRRHLRAIIYGNRGGQDERQAVHG